LREEHVQSGIANVCLVPAQTPLREPEDVAPSHVIFHSTFAPRDVWKERLRRRTAIKNYTPQVREQCEGFDTKILRQHHFSRLIATQTL
jgi:hypothetical protein